MASPPPKNHAGSRKASKEHEPDYRFTLANERTLLAWIRTGLALLACSIAIVQLVPNFIILDARKLLGDYSPRRA